MKIAVLSDIHANLEALNAVIETEDFQDCDVKINLGDSVGYYFQPREVLDSLLRNGFISVLGNHEEMLAKAMVSTDAREEILLNYGDGINVCMKECDSGQLHTLTSLPLTHTIMTEKGNLLFAHGGLQSTEEYYYPDSQLDGLLPDLPPNTRWIFFGNTHWPMIRYFEKTVILNPGSVGQPRQGGGGANWIKVDTDNESIAFLSVKYDFKKVIEAAKRHNPNLPQLWEVFFR